MAVKSGKARSPVRRSCSRGSAAVRAGDEAALLTFSEAELRTVLTEEYAWQFPMVKDLVKRLRRRQKGND